MKLHIKVILLSLITCIIFSSIALGSSYAIIKKSNNETAQKEVSATVHGFMDVLSYSDTSDANSITLRRFINMYTKAVLEVYEDYADTSAFDDYSLDNETEYLEAVATKTENVCRSIRENLTTIMQTMLVSNETESIYLTYFDVSRERVIYLLSVSKESDIDLRGYVSNIKPYGIDTSTDLPEEIAAKFGKNTDNEDICYSGSAIFTEAPNDSDEENAICAYLFADLPMTGFTSSLQQIFIYELISMIVVALLATIIMTVLTEKVLTKKIRKINNAQLTFKENLDKNESLVALNANVKSRDELGSLSDASYLLQERMVNYISEIKEKTQNEERINADLDLAAHIQSEALPSETYDNGIVKISAAMYPAREVGGDFYNYFRINKEEICILVADVSGKGIPASLFMMHSKVLLESLLKNDSNLSDTLFKLNNQLLEGNDSGLFLTSFVGILNEKTGTLRFINAGHEKPIIIHDGIAKIVEVNPNFILSGMENYEYKEESLKLSEGDSIFLYTDGLSEAINKNKEEFGLDRIVDSLNKNLSIDYLRNNIKEFSKGEEQFDDETYLLLTYNKHFKMKIDNPKIDDLAKVYENISTYILDKKLSGEINVVLDELLSNMVYYGLKKTKNPYLEVNLAIKKSSISLDLYNNGDEFNPFDVVIKEPDENGGFGISIVKSMMNKYTYERKDEINHIHLEKENG